MIDIDGNPVVQYVYTLGAAGERLSVAELDCTVAYTYDELYRLTSETITEGEKVTEYTYAYDSVGNRILKTKNGTETEYTYNELNQLVADSDNTYEYDLNGNLVRVIGEAQAALYTYDSENHLIRATVQSGNNVSVEEYEYDYAGNRTAKKSEGEYTKYLLDINGSLTYVLAEMDYNGTEKCFYTLGADLISQERNGRTYTYLYDGHGSVVGLMSEDGSVTDTYTYDAFGNLLKSTGRTANNYRYCGEQFDSATGLYYLRARYMDTSTGRFITQDSYAGSVYDPVSLHKYLYANSNPVMYSDPSGYFALADVSIAGWMNNQLDSINANACMWVLKSLNNAFSVIDTLYQMQNAEDWNGFFSALGKGLISGLINVKVLNKICDIKLMEGALRYILKAAAALGLIFQAESIAEALDDGDLALAVLRSAHLMVMVGLTFQSCFTGDTLVAFENEQKRIDEINVGDKVWAYNPETGETELKEVLNVWVKETDKLLHLETSDGEIIDTTTNHPFYVEDKGWVAAGDLEIGDMLYTVDGDTVEVTDIEVEKLDEPIFVYNLDVADFDTYFVGEFGILVHNYNSEPSPALDDSPYNPDEVAKRVKPPYESNPAHNTFSSNYNPAKTPEPIDAQSVYENALRGNDHTWFGVGEKGVYQFFSNGANYGDGTVHFAGILNSSEIQDIPVWIRRELGLN